MIVELVGPPGAGKSSLLGAARRLLAERGIEAAEATAAVDRTLAESRVGRLAKPLLNRHARRSRTLLVDLPYAIRFAVVEWRVTAIAVHAIWRAPVGWDHRAVLLGRFLTVAARSHYLRSRLSERAAAVFDEGLLHRTVNLFAWRTGSGSEARRYLAAVPVPDLAIFVDAPDAVALARLEIRGLPLRLRGRSPATVNAFVVNACSIARSIPLLTAGRVDWIRVDNVADLAAAERALESGWRAAARPHLLAGWPRFRGRFLGGLQRPDRWLHGRPRPIGVREAAEARALLPRWGLEAHGEIRRMGHGRSVNLLVETDDGALLLKRYKPTLEDAAIATEHAVLGRLADLGIPAVRLRPAIAGGTLVRDDNQRFAAYDAISGYVPLHHLVLLPSARVRAAHAAGVVLASVHRALADFKPPATSSAGLTDHGERAVPTSWHVERLAAMPRTAAGPSLVSRLIQLDRELERVDLSRSVIHGDYGPYNLLVHDGAPIVVADFELARVDWRAVDVSTAVPRFATGRLGHSAVRARAFLDGYLSIAPEMRGELSCLAAVLEFLSLRRAAVCHDRFVSGGEARWASEADRHLRIARSISAGAHPLVRSGLAAVA